LLDRSNLNQKPTVALIELVDILLFTTNALQNNRFWITWCAPQETSGNVVYQVVVYPMEGN
jgi:hypothetical protein